MTPIHTSAKPRLALDIHAPPTWLQRALLVPLANLARFILISESVHSMETGIQWVPNITLNNVRHATVGVDAAGFPILEAVSIRVAD
jgi:hypothetical protein